MLQHSCSHQYTWYAYSQELSILTRRNTIVVLVRNKPYLMTRGSMSKNIQGIPVEIVLYCHTRTVEIWYGDPKGNPTMWERLSLEFNDSDQAMLVAGTWADAFGLKEQPADYYDAIRYTKPYLAQ